MPTSGACAPVGAKATASRSGADSRLVEPQMAGPDGGQSAGDASGMLLPGLAGGAGPRARMFGLCSGSVGKRDTVVGRTRRRRTGKSIGNGEEWEEKTGDIAHLVTVGVFRFLFAMSSIFCFLFARLNSGSFSRDFSGRQGALVVSEAWRYDSYLCPARVRPLNGGSVPLP